MTFGGHPPVPVPLTQARIAEAFSRHDFDVALPFLAADVTWSLVGGKRIRGREEVVEWCRASAEYLAPESTRFLDLRVLTGEGWVVVESAAEYAEGAGERSRIAACDVYRFEGGAIAGITSYNIELPRE